MPDTTPSELWQLYVEAHARLVHCRMAMHPARKDLVDPVRKALIGPGLEASAALSYVPFLGEHAIEVADALVSVSLSVHGNTVEARKTLAALPRTEATAALKRAEDDVIAGNDYEAWACLFRLWQELGREDRARDLATQASVHEDEDIRDVGAAFLESQSH